MGMKQESHLPGPLEDVDDNPRPWSWCRAQNYETKENEGEPEVMGSGRQRGSCRWGQSSIFSRD